MTDLPIHEVGRWRWLTLCGGYRGEPFIKATPGVVIVAIDDEGQVLFQHEPRVYDNATVLGLPAGAVDEGEHIDVSANRELREETGFGARRLNHLHTFHPLSRHAEWVIDVFLARDLYEAPLQGDEGYLIEVVRHPLSTFETLMAAGKLHDSTTIAVLYMARTFLEREKHAEW